MPCILHKPQEISKERIIGNICHLSSAMAPTVSRYPISWLDEAHARTETILLHHTTRGNNRGFLMVEGQGVNPLAQGGQSVSHHGSRRNPDFSE
jgi:hypothetical protein